MNTKNTENIKKICGMAIFIALAIVTTLMTKWLQIAHLTFDAKDAVITVAAFIYGPISAIIISITTSLIETFAFGGDTGLWGLIMNIFSSVAFSLTASLIYTKKRNINGAIISLCAATAVTTAVMLLLNIFIAPLFFGLPLFDPFIMNMIPLLILPFNFAKSLMNGAIVIYLYKPITLALRKAKLVQGSDKAQLSFNKNSRMILICGLSATILSVALLLLTYYLNV